MSTQRRVRPPSGMAPPATARLPDGQVVDLAPLAREITAAHLRRHPEDAERYGAELAGQWCTHDNQHVLAWAVADLDLEGQLGWLARILSSRGYPVANLVDNVRTGAQVVGDRLPQAVGREVAQRMRAAAERLESQMGS